MSSPAWRATPPPNDIFGIGEEDDTPEGGRRLSMKDDAVFDVGEQRDNILRSRPKSARAPMTRARPTSANPRVRGGFRNVGSTSEPLRMQSKGARAVAADEPAAPRDMAAVLEEPERRKLLDPTTTSSSLASPSSSRNPSKNAGCGLSSRNPSKPSSRAPSSKPSSRNPSKNMVGATLKFSFATISRWFGEIDARGTGAVSRKEFCFALHQNQALFDFFCTPLLSARDDDAAGEDNEAACEEAEHEGRGSWSSAGTSRTDAAARSGLLLALEEHKPLKPEDPSQDLWGQFIHGVGGTREKRARRAVILKKSMDLLDRVDEEIRRGADRRQFQTRHADWYDQTTLSPEFKNHKRKMHKCRTVDLDLAVEYFRVQGLLLDYQSHPDRNHPDSPTAPPSIPSSRAWSKQEGMLTDDQFNPHVG